MIENIRAVLSEMGFDRDLLHDQARLRADLGMDRTKMTRLEVELEERCGVRVNACGGLDYSLHQLAEMATEDCPGRPGDADYRHRGWWRAELLDDLVLGLLREGEADRTALVGDGRALTRRELDAAVSACAGRLADAGIRPDQHVLVQLPNRVQFIILVLGLIRLGAPPVLALPALREYELDFVLTQLQPVAMAFPARQDRFDHLGLAERLRERYACLRRLITEGDVDPARGHLDLDRLVAGSQGTVGGWQRDPSDAALFLLSSGTTGAPKPIPRTHEAFGHVVRSAAAVSGLTSDSVYLAVMPVAHSFVLGHPGILGTIAHGGKVVLGTPEEPARALALIERERVTHCALTPALARQWLAGAGSHRYDFTSLEVLQVGGARLDEDTAARLSERFACKVQQVYGMSEGLLTFTRLDDAASIVRSTQGRPISPGDDIRIVDDQGNPVPDGQIGELIVRGPSVIRGYYGDVGRSSFTTDGYYKTGDLIYRHESGNLVVAGRVKDVINRGGEKIPADELDALAQRHPDVRAAAAVAMPHPALGEAVCLYVVGGENGGPSLREIRRFLEAQGLASFKLPQRVVKVSTLPTIGIGKVNKAQLRKDIAGRVAAEYGEEGTPS